MNYILYDDTNEFQSCMAELVDGPVRVPVFNGMDFENLIRICNPGKPDVNAILFDDNPIFNGELSDIALIVEKFIRGTAFKKIYVFCQNKDSAQRITNIGADVYNRTRAETNVFLHPVDPSTIFDNIPFAGISGAFMATSLVAHTYSADTKETEQYRARWSDLANLAAKYGIMTKTILSQLVNMKDGINMFCSIKDHELFYNLMQIGRLYDEGCYTVEDDKNVMADDIEELRKKCVIYYPFPSEQIANYFFDRMPEIDEVIFHGTRHGEEQEESYERKPKEDPIDEDMD